MSPLSFKAQRSKRQVTYQSVQGRALLSCYHFECQMFDCTIEAYMLQRLQNFDWPTGQLTCPANN